jgi:hypothetical protein
MRRARQSAKDARTGARTLPRHWATAAALLAGLMLFGPSINHVGDTLFGRIAPALVANPD